MKDMLLKRGRQETEDCMLRKLWKRQRGPQKRSGAKTTSGRANKQAKVKTKMLKSQ